MAKMNKEDTRQYLQHVPLAEALWWFIENRGLASDALDYEELFFLLRERFRNEHLRSV